MHITILKMKVVGWEMILAFSLTVYAATCSYGLFVYISAMFFGQALDMLPVEQALTLLAVVVLCFIIMYIVGGTIDGLHAQIAKEEAKLCSRP